MRPRVLIIQPSHYRSRSDLSPHRIRKRSLVGLTLPYLAALTPKAWDITLVDEQLTGIDFDVPADVVAVTTWTINSLRAYEVAEKFRERRVPVIMGGPHTFFYPEESAGHCDGVGIGEGETIWATMLEDAISGRLRKYYHARGPEDLSGLPLPRHDLLDLSRHGRIKTFTVQASRGCPFECEFCSERLHLGKAYRYRPVSDIVEEIKHGCRRNIFFADSNFAGNLHHTMELMEALIPFNLRWSCLLPAYLCNKREFMDLAKRSGLLHVNIGIESIDQETLAGLGKKSNKVRRYKEALNNLRQREISYSLNFIFGWDTEKSDVFASTLDFLREERVPVAYFNVLTPHKGTALYDRMASEGRIIDIDHIGRWPGIHCHIKPMQWSARELEESVRRLYHRFYSYPSMLLRLPLLPLSQSRMASWVMNISQRRVSRRTSETENFDDL